MRSCRSLGHENWSDSCEGSRTETSYDARNKDEVARLRSSLQGATYESKDGTNEEPVDTPDPICRPTTSKTTHNTTEVVNGNNASLVDIVRHLAVRQANADLFDVLGGGIDTTHDTLVVSLEEYADERKCLDGDIQLGRGQALPKRGVAHGDWRHEESMEI